MAVLSWARMIFRSSFLLSIVVACVIVQISRVDSFNHLFQARSSKTALHAEQRIAFDPQTKAFSFITSPKADPKKDANVDRLEALKLSSLLQAYKEKHPPHSKDSKVTTGSNKAYGGIPLHKIVAQLLQQKRFVTIEDDVKVSEEPSQTVSLPTSYITEWELQELWEDNSGTTFGIPIDQFSLPDALLLVEDEDDMELGLEEREDIEDVFDEKREDDALYVTTQVLDC